MNNLHVINENKVFTYFEHSTLLLMFAYIVYVYLL